MITILYALILMLFSMMAIKKEKVLLNPITILCGLWSIIIFFSKLELFTLYSTNDNTYKIIFIGIISFIIGFYLFKFLFKGKSVYIKIGPRDFNSNKFCLRYKLSYIIALFCILFLTYTLFKHGKNIFINGYSLSAIQGVMQEGDISNTGIINAINFLFVNPMYIVLTVITAVDFSIGKKDKFLLTAIVMITIGRIFTSGGRQAFIQLFLSLLISFTFLTNMKTGKNKRKEIKKIYKLAFLSVIVLGLLSFSRTQYVLKTIYLDFAMQPYMFEKWSFYLVENNECAHGFSSIMGFIYPILYVLKNVFNIFSEVPMFFENIFQLNMLPINQWINIGSELRANAYVSVFWYLFYDGRIFGIILGMLVFGLFSANIFYKAKNTACMKNMSLYVLMANCIFYTFGDMEFSKVNVALAFMYLHILVFKKCYKEVNE